MIDEAIRMRRSGRLDEADDAIRLLVSHHPDNPRLPAVLGVQAEARGDLDRAEQIYRSAVAQRPQEARLRLHWARVLARMKRDADAMDALLEGLEISPYCVDLLAQLVSLQQKLGLVEAAGASMVPLTQLDPGNVLLPRLRAGHAAAIGEVETAQRHLEADAAAFPDDTKRRMRWMSAMRRSGEIGKVIDIIGRRTAPETAEQRLRVSCLLDSGRWDEADRFMAMAAETCVPQELHELQRHRLRLAMLRFQHVEAMRLAREILASAPDDVMTWRTLARAAAARFDVETAWAALLRIPFRSRNGGRPRAGSGALRSLTGQLVNELRLRPEETVALAQACARGADALVDCAASLLRTEPGSVGAALGLLVGRTVAGGITTNAFTGMGGPTRIPGHIHQFWDSDVTPPDIERLMARTRDLNTRHSYRRWTDAAARRYLATLGLPEVLRAYRTARHVAMRADLFRLAVLFAEGGVYLDADDYCAMPLSTLMPPGAELVCYQEDLGSIGNNFLAATPRHPILGAALREAAEAVLQGATESLWLVSGPGLLSRIVAREIARMPDLQPPAGLKILSLEVFSRCVHPHRRVSYKADARHWARAI